jgi:hypothetical protein
LLWIGQTTYASITAREKGSIVHQADLNLFKIRLKQVGIVKAIEFADVVMGLIVKDLHVKRVKLVKKYHVSLVAPAAYTHCIIRGAEP